MTDAIPVTFASGATRCAGRLHLPAARAARVPCVVLCHGFSGTMDRLTAHAERFAAAGLAALAFDYRSFGESGGEPRQVVDLSGQQDDLRAAIAFARGCEQVDPGAVAVWGNSLGGALAISVAADDPRLVAVVAQIPFNGFPRKVEGRSTRATLRLLAAILWDAARGRLGLSPFYIPMVGRPGTLAVAATADASRHVETLSGGGADTRWRNRVAPRALLAMMRYRPAEAAARLTMPLLVCAGADDRETSEQVTRELAERAPRGEFQRFPGSHWSFYADPAIRDRALDAQIAFIRRALDGEPAAPQADRPA